MGRICGSNLWAIITYVTKILSYFYTIDNNLLERQVLQRQYSCTDADVMEMLPVDCFVKIQKQRGI